MIASDNLKSGEKRAIEELQRRFENVLPPDIKDDETLFYRFLKARDFDLNKAEILLKKHLDWRKAFQVDTILETLQPKEVYLKYLGSCFVAFDKDGDLLNYEQIGKKEPKEIMNAVKVNDLMKYLVWLMEKYLLLLKNENKRTGRRAFQMSIVFDLEGTTLARLTNKQGTDILIRVLCLMQDNYPERTKNMIVINAPAYFTMCFSILKNFMSREMQKKFHVFGQNGWKEALLKLVDIEALPAFLGGSRTDPDGNPLCRTIIREGGPIPPKYFLSPEERDFQDKNKVKNITVPVSDNVKIPVEVKECNSFIQWEFETKNKDIGFGLFFQESEEELEEVLPIQKIATIDGTETGSFKALSAGMYVIVFDNSYSWRTSKEVYYCITVQAPN